MIGHTVVVRRPLIGHFQGALLDNGIYGFVRPPFLHCAPALVIKPEELEAVRSSDASHAVVACGRRTTLNGFCLISFDFV